MSRERVLSDAQWERIEALMPSSDGVRSQPLRDHRQVVEGVIYRFRTGIAGRDLPPSFGPWLTVWKRHHRFSSDGTWDKIHAGLLAEAQAAGDIDWMVSVDATINRAHQHATNTGRVEEPAGRCRPAADPLPAFGPVPVPLARGARSSERGGPARLRLPRVRRRPVPRAGWGGGVSR